MFFFADLLLLRNNKKGRLPACWIAATSQIFIGSGPNKLSKNQIENVNLLDACDDIIQSMTGSESIPRFSLYLSSMLTYGALRIFQSQTNFLNDECEKLYLNVIATKKRKLNKKIQESSIDIILNEDLPNINIEELFQADENRVDVNLITEDPPLPPLPAVDNYFDFFQEGDSSEFYGRVPSGFGISDEEVNSIAEIRQALSENGLNVDISTTPKRKTHQSHKETPTKKKRTSTTTLTSTTFDNPQQASTPVVRKSITFDLPDNYANSLAITNNVEEMEVIDSSAQVPPEHSVAILPEQERSELALPLPTEVPMLNEDQFSNIANQETLDEFRLEEITDESLNLKNRNKLKRLKKIIDQEKQINLSEKNFKPKVHTKSANSYRLKLRDKISAEELLMLPSTALKMVAHPNKRCLKWASTLLSLYCDSLQNIRNQNFRKVDDRSGSFPRDAHVNKDRRLSRFQQSLKTEPSLSSNETTKLNENNGDMDFQPLLQIETSHQSPQTARPNLEAADFDSQKVITPNPNENNGDMDFQPLLQIETSHQSPQTARPNLEAAHSDSQKAITPRQGQKNASKYCEPQVAVESPRGPYDFEKADMNFSARMPQTETNELLPHSPSEESIEVQSSLLMTSEVFYQAIIKGWEISGNYGRSGEKVICLLDDILPLKKISVKELITYFFYLCGFEKSGVLWMVQKRPYTPVILIKTSTS